MEAGYSTCCSHGFCSGRPATCSCNPDCHNLGDCCNDIDDTCPRGEHSVYSANKTHFDIAISHTALPQPPNVELIYLTHISAVIQWTVPTIVFSSEQYTLQYGIDMNQLNMQSQSYFSGTDISVKDQVYSVRLEDLSPATTYYYRVETVNTHGTTYTDVLSFSTRMFVLFLLFGLLTCVLFLLHLSFILQPMLDHPRTLLSLLEVQKRSHSVGIFHWK